MYILIITIMYTDVIYTPELMIKIIEVYLIIKKYQ